MKHLMQLSAILPCLSLDKCTASKPFLFVNGDFFVIVYPLEGIILGQA